MYLVTQNSPEKKILFASSSAFEAYRFFSWQINSGEGWFELWLEGDKKPLREGGEKFFAPHPPKKTHSTKTLSGNTTTVANPEEYFFSVTDDRLMLTMWE